MPRPTSATTVQRPDLGVLAYEHLLDAPARGFIGMEVMPVFEVPEKTADYPIIPIESLLKKQDTRRAARAGYQRGDWEFTTGTYNCEEYGWEEPVDDVEAALYQRFFDAEMVATEIATDRIVRGHEERVAAACESGGADADVTNEWDDAANATPHADVMAGKVAMRAASGLVPNAIALSWTAFQNVLATSELTGRFQYTAPLELAAEEEQRRILARYFGVGTVLVGNAIQDIAKKGQTRSIADIWDDEYAHLLRLSAGGQRLREPVFGRTFLWYEDAPQQVVTETYREEQTRSQIVRARQHVDEAVVFAAAKYSLGNITS